LPKNPYGIARGLIVITSTILEDPPIFRTPPFALVDNSVTFSSLINLLHMPVVTAELQTMSRPVSVFIILEYNY
jgi:hypothetical protein